jgi:hypothetical protein
MGKDGSVILVGYIWCARLCLWVRVFTETIQSNIDPLKKRKLL